MRGRERGGERDGEMRPGEEKREGGIIPEGERYLPYLYSAFSLLMDQEAARGQQYCNTAAQGMDTPIFTCRYIYIYVSRLYPAPCLTERCALLISISRAGEGGSGPAWTSCQWSCPHRGVRGH